MQDNLSPYQNPTQQYQNPAQQQGLQQQQSDYQKTVAKRQSQNQKSDSIFHGMLKQLQDLEMSGIDTQSLGQLLQQMHDQERIHQMPQKQMQQQGLPQQTGKNPLQQLMQGGQQAIGNVGKTIQSIPQQASAGWQDFVKMAQQIAQKRNFPVGVLLGQAALESARGSAAPGNNFFGIKGSGTAGSNVMATKEYAPSKGYYGENSGFAAYKTPQDAINAYLDLIQNAYGVKTTDPTQALQQIKQHGYATSPTYVQDVMNTPEFQGLAGGVGTFNPPGSLGAMQAASQTARGVGALADLDRAVAAQDTTGIQKAVQAISNAPAGSPLAAYKSVVAKMFPALAGGSSVTLDAIPMIAPLGPYQQLLQKQQRGGVNQ